MQTRIINAAKIRQLRAKWDFKQILIEEEEH